MSHCQLFRVKVAISLVDPPTQLFYIWISICVHIQISKTQQGNLLLSAQLAVSKLTKQVFNTQRNFNSGQQKLTSVHQLTEFDYLALTFNTNILENKIAK